MHFSWWSVLLRLIFFCILTIFFTGFLFGLIFHLFYTKIGRLDFFSNNPHSLHHLNIFLQMFYGKSALSELVLEEIWLQFAVTHGRIDGRELVNIEIDICGTAEIELLTVKHLEIAIFDRFSSPFRLIHSLFRAISC